MLSAMPNPWNDSMKRPMRGLGMRGLGILFLGILFTLCQESHTIKVATAITISQEAVAAPMVPRRQTLEHPPNF
jgi:hypothetical protein